MKKFTILFFIFSLSLNIEAQQQINFKKIKSKIKSNKKLVVADFQMKKHVLYTPIESTYFIPMEFIRLGKTNLDFRVYPYEHSFVSKKDGNTTYHFKEVFQEFIDFLEKD